MKVFYLLVFFCLLSADAQRRSVKSELLSENESPPKSARRGRARFTVTTDTPEVEEHKRPDPPGRRLTSRRRPETHTEAPIRKTYEVEEVVDDTPIEPFRKSGKSRVLTENKFEAHNAPSSNALFQSATTESLDEALKSVDTGVVDTTSSSEPSSSTVSTNLESSASELTSGEISKIDNEISRSQPETTTPITSRTTRRSNGRSRSHGGAAPSPTVASRARSRSRATRKPEEQSIATPAPSRPVHRGSRRRADSTGAEARTRGPSVIGAAETVELPSRSRTGRKIPGGTRRSEEKAPEKITIDLPQPRRSNGRKSVEVTTGRSRLRSRSREVPPVIDEQKLEVLPLFERETKTVRPVRKLVSRRRNLNSAEEVETSATENDVKVAPKPPRQSVVVETRTESSVKRRKTNKLVTQGTKPTVKSTIKSTTKPAVKKSVKPVIKESVVSEVTEVTSKRTVTRKKLLPRTNFESPGFTSRGVKKSEVNLTAVKKNKSGLTSSEEEIDDSDNYPEQFKALLQAKKQKKESRPLHRVVTASPTITKTTEKVVNSLSSTTTQATTSEASRQLEDSENELDPKSARPTRRRFSHSTATRPTRKSKVVARSTTAAPPKDHRFHAKFNTEQEATTASSVRPTRGFSPKPPRGLYSSRKNKESYAKSKSGSSTTTAQIPIPKKHNRYSSRYRNDASSRGAIRTSTNAPAYLPTIPTITPPTTSVKSAFQDKDLGVEVISFDDPVNTVPSANLVSGEYLASSTENHLTSPLVSASQTKTTEKPVSIIERIINSITAISTTEVPHPTRLTTPTTETPTKESAILKLATKKSTKLDKTQTTQKIPVVTVTSEKPTTIIERILSSLSAIQVDNSTDSKNFKSKQVGTNFNTISSPSTTPITRVTKSTLPAQFSTSVNPLIVLDEISNEQTLQKRTIGKLLALLNTLTSTTASSHPTQLVVVTPKTTNYVVGTSAATTTTTVPTTTVPSTTTTTDQLFTSPNPGGASLGSRSKPPESTTVRYTSTPTITTLSTQAPTTPFAITSTPSPTLTSSEASSTSTTPGDFANELAPLPLSIESGVTSLAIDSTTPSTTDSSLSVSSTLPTTELAVDTETAFAFPSTIPALVNFEVSPGSVSIFSANDLSNAITPDDFRSTTITIPGRTNIPETVITTQSSTEGTTPLQTTTPIPNSADSNATTQTVNVESRIGTESSTAGTATTVPSTTTAGTATTVPSTTTGSTATTVPSTTAAGVTQSPSTTQIPSTSTTAAGGTQAPSTTAASGTEMPGTTLPPSTTAGATVAPSTTVSPGTTVANPVALSAVTTDSATQAPSTTAAGTTQAPSTTAAGTTQVPSSTVAGTTQASSSTVAGTTEAPSSTAASATTAASPNPLSIAGGTTLAPSTTPAATTTLAPTTTAANNTTQDITSNEIDTTGSPEKSNQTSTVSSSTNTPPRSSGRSGRLLNIVQDPVQNSIETTTSRNKDYFIFAVLNNNTVLRKRPSRFPTKDTPFLIVGVYPNNTIVRKFPNGSFVPMEPVIRVSGFDTRENPPPLPEITSNQVTPDQGSRPENKNLQTVDQNTIPPLVANPLSLSTVNNATTTTGTTPSSTVPSVQANPLSISSTSSSTNESSTSPTTISSSSTPAAAVTTTPGTTTSSTAPTATLPTLTEILNGRTVQAFNSIINISDLSKVQTLDVDPKSNPVTTTLPTPTLSNRILDDPVASATSALPTTQQPTTTTTTAAPTTTTAAPTTTTAPPTTTTASTTTTLPPTTTATATTRRQRTTVLPLSQPATTTFRTTTGFPSTTFFPTFLTTLFSTIRPRRLSTTESPITIVTPISNRVQPTTTPRIGINTISGDLAAASTTRTVSTTPVPTTTLLSTLPVSTTIRSTRRRGTAPTTTALPVTTTVLTTTIPTSTASASARNARRSTAAPKVTSTSATKKLKKLTEQQKKDLETLAQLEMEQAAILKQLAFLTNLNFAGMKPTTEKNDLANRIIALAVERDKGREKVTTVASETLSSEGSRQAKKIAPSDEQSLEELVKQLNIATPSTLTTQYGKSNDAIVAALLKEQGIGPTTPKIVEDIYSQTTTTTRRPKPKPTTRAPGPLMQSLNWLLNVLAPPTTKRPRPKPKPKPKPKPEPTSEELLTHQPTHITPVVTPAPRQNIVSSLSQEDIQKLIKQLEQIQKDPKNSQNLDFSSINSLQSLIGSNGVQVSSAGTTGTTTRETTPLSTTKTRVAKSTTAIPLSVSNSIVDDDFVSTTTTKPRVSLPPVKLRPVPGIEDSDTLVRGQLINAAVNVTRAISSFLGTALQGAATSFQSLLGSGSRVVGSLMQVSSNTSSRPG
ncbi:hypothetical protein MTP99_012186 [Tenebrio molitor]|nr:hypothetical protein MTP99_012186 [Tenebrio molitor]